MLLMLQGYVCKDGFVYKSLKTTYKIFTLLLLVVSEQTSLNKYIKKTTIHFIIGLIILFHISHGLFESTEEKNQTSNCCFWREKTQDLEYLCFLKKSIKL